MFLYSGKYDVIIMMMLLSYSVSQTELKLDIEGTRLRPRSHGTGRI